MFRAWVPDAGISWGILLFLSISWWQLLGRMRILMSNPMRPIPRRHPLKSKLSRLTMVVALTGATACFLAVVRFLTTMKENGLAWTPGLDARDHYLAVGNSYSAGFIAGFFLCFFLAVFSVAVHFWREDRRQRCAVADVASHEQELLELQRRLEMGEPMHPGRPPVAGC